jgi:hypothetical protein
MYTDQDIANLVARVQMLEQQVASKQVGGLPNTALISRNFLSRAFAVWGHFFVSNLLISLALSCIMVIIGLILGKGIVELITQLTSNLTGFLP